MSFPPPVEDPPPAPATTSSFAAMATSGSRRPTTVPPESDKVAPPIHQFSFSNMDQERVVVHPKSPTSLNGMPSIAFNETEVNLLSASFELTLIGKFSYGIPRIFDVTKMLNDLKLKSRFNISFMDKRHVVIQLFLEEDFNRLWLWDNPNVEGVPLRFFKWTPTFSLEDESPIVPVWVSLENLPIFMFHKEALFEIGKLIGNPVKIDGYTTNKSKLNQANICIYLDVSKPLISHLWIKVLEKGTAIKVSYGRVPHYCMNCHKLGHLESNCLARENLPNEHVAAPTRHVEHPRPEQASTRPLNHSNGNS